MLVDTLKAQVIENGADFGSDEYVAMVVKMMKERINLPQELWEQCNFFFKAPTEFDEKSMKKWWKPEAPQYVAELCDFMEAQDDWNGETLEPKVMEWIASKEYKTGQVMNAFRVTLVGAARGPQIFSITDMLGKEESLRRARKAVAELK